ncbi:MAG: cytoplasmic protein, partial [Deltaproteobacteria bacterium]|nr:cytoplasmic protein [Deltaproteobacteria bacterium]
MKKIVLFVFNGDPMCFIHVLLNAMDMKAKTYDIKIIIEGSAVQLIPELIKEGHTLNK